MSAEKDPRERSGTEHAGDLAGVSDERRTTGERVSGAGARRFGYTVAILVNVALLYAFNNWLGWHLPFFFLTERFADCLWALNLSLGATIVGNALFLFYDARPFKSLVQIVMNCFGFLSTYTIYQVFPFSLERVPWEYALRIALIAAMFGIVVSTIAESFKLLSGKGNEHRF